MKAPISLCSFAVLLPVNSGTPAVQSQTFVIGAHRITAQYIRVSPKEFEPDIAWPSTGLGNTAEMSAIAKGAHADIAINGCFFDAYLPSVRKNPNQNLVQGGRVVHIGSTGCMLGFDPEGNSRIERVHFLYRGWVSNERGRQSWYSYRANDTPTGSNLAGVYDSAYGREVDLPGVKIVVQDGRVSDITQETAELPSGGYVILLQGSETSMAARFSVGASVERRLEVQNGDDTFWQRATTGVGGGPKLLTRGQVDLQMEAEGFSNPKITSGSFGRSLVGIDRDGNVVLAVSSGTMGEMARVMQGLGCVEAMNLDGGASSSLWTATQGYVRRPGRPLTNLLIFRRR